MRSKKLVQIGTIGVDCGMVYIGDPCYIARTPLGMTGDDPQDKHWDAFLQNITQMIHAYAAHSVVTGTLPNGTSAFPAALCVRPAPGDGEYPVYAEFEAGRIIKVVIEFD
jgi:hypothetical protein